MYYGYTESYFNVFPVFAAVCAVVLGVTTLWGIAVYVMKALSLYTIAKRRGLSGAWLSWLPVGQEWILGNVSDQYKYLVRGKSQSWRKVVLALSALGAVFSLVAAWMGIGVIGNLLVAGRYMSTNQMISVMTPSVVALVLVALVAGGVNIASYVFCCLCKYDLYRSCDPKNAVLFLVIGVLFGVTEPFFWLVCRNKDLGMPPRKPDPEEITGEPEVIEGPEE